MGGSAEVRAARTEEQATRCFHCSEPLLGSTLTARLDGLAVPVCCLGCLAVAELIAGSGLSDYYRLREAAGARPDSAAGAADTWSAFTSHEVAAQFTRSNGEIDSATLAVDGLRCAACSWLIDRVLKSTPGVQDASTNTVTGRIHVSWSRNQLTLADVARTIARLGYRPTPLNDENAFSLQQQESRDALKRLAVAAFGMMQVMMFAVATYSADMAGEIMDPLLSKFFRGVSLLVATPVMFYAGGPIFAGALRSLRSRAIGMDMPVTVALGLAYGASVWNTLGNAGADVYFDSVTMFIFFLTLGRWVQMTVRHRTTSVADALARQLPAYAHRLEGDKLRDVAVAALRRGDVVLVRHGEILAADAELLDAEAKIDESLLTGESIPVRKRVGSRVAAGTLNVGNPIHVRVIAVANGTTLSHIVTLLQQAQAQRPTFSRTADAAASRFLSFVLIGAALTCASWLIFDPARAFETTLSVLVVACPCAFAIAMPAAISAATAHLARIGVLVTRVDAIETLTRIDRVVFDKTGTLTQGDIALHRCVALNDIAARRCLEIAAALERASEHPLARAFADFGTPAPADQVRSVPGAGVEGIVDGRRYRVGTPEFVAGLRGQAEHSSTAAQLAGTVVMLGDEVQELASFELHDVPRRSAAPAVASLGAMGVRPQVLSGDSQSAVAAVADCCGIQDFLARRSPEQKLAHVQELQRQGDCVAMIGDGVNDAPVLAAADLSIAMGGGAALAHAGADMILVSENLRCLPEAIRIARHARRIARQNLVWSAAYNFGSLPLAACGWIPPWLAALGMSLSSIAVVLNAARLLPSRPSNRAGSHESTARPADLPWMSPHWARAAASTPEETRS